VGAARGLSTGAPAGDRAADHGLIGGPQGAAV
jgi:hypothetical protein